MKLKTCPCGEQVLTLITDLEIGAKICHKCAPDKNSNEAKVARKMHEIFMLHGNLDSYPLEERLANLAGRW